MVQGLFNLPVSFSTNAPKVPLLSGWSEQVTELIYPFVLRPPLFNAFATVWASRMWSENIVIITTKWRRSIISPTSIFTLGRGFRSLCSGNSCLSLRVVATLESSLSIVWTLHGWGSEFPGAPGPVLEDDINRSSKDTLENRCDSEYSKYGNNWRPAHCDVEDKKVSKEWVEWDQPKKRHPLYQSFIYASNILNEPLIGLDFGRN